MAWTTPPTFVSGTALTAAQLNILSANLNETTPAKATAAGQYFVASAVNAIAARTPQSASVTTTQTTTSAAFTDLATVGPQVTVTSGTQCLMLMNSLLQNNTSGTTTSISMDVSGTTTIAAGTIYLSFLTAAVNHQITIGGVRMQPSLTAGAGNIFTMKYACSGGSTATFARRFLTVLPF